MTVKLTRREQSVLLMLADGLSAEQIARRHFVHPSTVKSQTKKIYQKLGATCAGHAVVLGYRAGYIKATKEVPPVNEGMVKEFAELLRLAQTTRTEGYRVYFECSRIALAVLGPPTRDTLNPAALLFGFPIYINDHLAKPRLVVESGSS